VQLAPSIFYPVGMDTTLMSTFGSRQTRLANPGAPIDGRPVLYDVPAQRRRLTIILHLTHIGPSHRHRHCRDRKRQNLQPPTPHRAASFSIRLPYRRLASTARLCKLVPWESSNWLSCLCRSTVQVSSLDQIQPAGTSMPRELANERSWPCFLIDT
jgi:hypothetical protein